MKEPFLSTFVNLGEMVDVDKFYKIDKSATQVAGLGYVSISATTQNSDFEKITPATNTFVVTDLRDDGASISGTVPIDPTEGLFPSNNRWWKDQENHKDSDGNFMNYGALQLLRFKMF